MFKYFRFVLLLVAGFSLASVSEGASLKKHALAKVASVAAMPVKHAKFLSKATLGSALFAVESGVDGVHLVLFSADKAFDAISIKGKVPVLDSIYAFVSAANTDTGKLDLWLERQEDFLFGRHN